jgi:cation:H+ antiporter
MTLALLAFQFVLCAAVIAGAGFVLCRSADRLADSHGWGRGWVGLALLATVTSLPELVSGVSAVAWVDAPNLAVGGALGACVFNLAFLVVVDLVQREQPIYRAAGGAHLLTAAFGVVMLGFVALSVLTAERAPAVFHLGVYSPLLLGLYLFALRSVQKHEQLLALAGAVVAPQVKQVPKGDWLRFAASAALVVAAGIWLPSVADGLATQLGLGRSFVGTVVMALVTTMPEMAVTVAALRLRALDMAIANLLGSNLFNAAILAVDDAVYLRGPLLAHVLPVHAGTAITAALMSGMVIIGLLMRPKGRVLRTTSWVGLALASAYAINTALAYLHAGG